MITDATLRTVLESVIFDLQRVLNTTKEESTSMVVKDVIKSLNEVNASIEDKQFKNLIKRILYQRMTNIKHEYPEISKELYNTYQSLKADKISSEEALNTLNRVCEVIKNVV